MMKALDDIKKEILQHLLERYMENSTGRYSIDEIIASYDVPAADLVFILKEDGLVDASPDGVEPAIYSITVKGINEADPDYFADRLATVMNELGLHDREWVSVRDATGIHDIKRVHDIGSALAVTDYFEVLRNIDDVQAKLTAAGRTYFEQHRKEFI